jgi:hypothetical protein
MDVDQPWMQLRLNDKIQNLYATSSFPWALRDALGDTLLEATLDEKKLADKQKVMQNLQELCKASDETLESVFVQFIGSFDKPSQSYTELKRLVTAERKIIRSLESTPDEPVQQTIKAEPMDTDEDIFAVMSEIRANVSALPD